MFMLKKTLAAAGVVATVLVLSAAVLWIGLGPLGMFWFLGVWPFIVLATVVCMLAAE